jgi:hypothetical protein
MTMRCYGRMTVDPSVHYPALDDTTIRDAVVECFADPVAATAEYGSINSWNTGLVTNMESLFLPKTSLFGIRVE